MKPQPASLQATVFDKPNKAPLKFYNDTIIMERDVNINIHTLLKAMCGAERKGITYMHLSLVTACHLSPCVVSRHITK